MFARVPPQQNKAATGKQMTKILNLIKQLHSDERGAAMVEYTVLIGILLTAVMTFILSIGNWVGDKWTTLNTTLTG